MITSQERHDSADSAAAVVAHVRDLIDCGALRPGGRLPAERELAQQIGVSRPTVRAGLRTLAALGVVRSRRGSGTYIPSGPPTLGAEALSFLAALHKFTVDDIYEVRRILEVGAAGLAAERATPNQLAALADDVAGLFASLADPHLFFAHDISFHRGIAAASRNPIVASLVEMVSALHFEQRRATAQRAADRDLRDAADAHRQIYHAVRARDAERARRTMNDHLVRARAHRVKEIQAIGVQGSGFDVQGSGFGVRDWAEPHGSGFGVRGSAFSGSDSPGSGSGGSAQVASTRGAKRRTANLEARTPNAERRTPSHRRAAR
jgi:GntR family transcriptional repressor for pyruvate dehydrogenase complex